MAKDNVIWIVIIGLIVLGGYMVINHIGPFLISSSSTVTRSVLPTVNPGSTFTLSYTANGVSGNWGNSIVDSVSGGCTINGKSSLNFVMLSDLPNPITYTVTAPASGSCTFTGSYEFGNLSVTNMANSIVNVVVCTPSCVRPSNQCTLGSSVSNGCSGTCASSWTVTQLNSDDSSCNGKIDRTELGVAINGWTAGTVSRTQLGQDISSWSSG